MNPADLSSLKGNLEGLYQSVKSQESLRQELKRIKNELEKLKPEISAFKSSILDALKKQNQEGMKYKDLTITVHSKYKRYYPKKAEKERLLFEALQSCGIDDAKNTTLSVIEALKSRAHTGVEDTLKIKKK